MNASPSTRSRRVLAALLRIGWVVKRQSGSHRTLSRTGWADSPVRFAVCIKNEGDEVSLEIGKLYRVISDESAQGHGYPRIVDESWEDYGYAADRFVAIDVPEPLERALLKVAP